MRKKNESVELPRVNHFFKSPFFFMRIKKKKKNMGRYSILRMTLEWKRFLRQTDRKFGRSVCFFFSLSVSLMHTHANPPQIWKFSNVYTPLG